MYSILPSFVSALFLGCGIYAISIKGINRVSGSFLLLCLATAAWQGVWSVLFQAQSEATAIILIKIGYSIILFLPSSFYLFVAQVCNKGTERRYVLASYSVALLLLITLVWTGKFLADQTQYHYFFGYYPKAGPVHPVHALQSVLIATRCSYLCYDRYKTTTGREHTQMTLCLVGVVIYCFAALDYLCNYGVEMYPPGVIFLCISVGCFAWAILRFDLMHPYSLAASVAHEIRTPLATIKLYSDEIARSLPKLCAVYLEAVKEGRTVDTISQSSIDRLATIPDSIGRAVRQSYVNIDTFMAVVRELDASSFSYFSIGDCVEHAIAEYPFSSNDRDLVQINIRADYQFFGSKDLLTFVLFNLLKNALWAIRSAKKGNIKISAYSTPKGDILEFHDTGIGILPDNLPYVFDEFFTTRRQGGTGVGLSFCRHVIRSFGGKIRCSSEYGASTTFFLEFPPEHSAVQL